MTFSAPRNLLWSHFVVITPNLCRSAVKVVVFLSFENLLTSACQDSCLRGGAEFVPSQEAVNPWQPFRIWLRSRTPVVLGSRTLATGQRGWTRRSIQHQLQQLLSRNIQKTHSWHTAGCQGLKTCLPTHHADQGLHAPEQPVPLKQSAREPFPPRALHCLPPPTLHSPTDPTSCGKLIELQVTKGKVIELVSLVRFIVSH